MFECFVFCESLLKNQDSSGIPRSLTSSSISASPRSSPLPLADVVRCTVFPKIGVGVILLTLFDSICIRHKKSGGYNAPPSLPNNFGILEHDSVGATVSDGIN